MESSFKEIVCQIDTEWKFKKADLMDLKENGYLTGKFFYAYNIPGIQYFISIFPNGYNEDSRGQTLISFYVKGSEERKIVAKFKISIESANYSEKFYYVYDDDHGYGEEICKTADFFESKSKYFVDDEITIKVYGTLKVIRTSFSEICCPFDTEWKFKKADLMDVKENEFMDGKYYYAYNIPGLRYHVIIFPNKKGEISQEETGIFLHVNGSKKRKIDADYTVSIESANYSETCTFIFDKSTPKGRICCKTTEFFDSKSKYFVNGEITIKVYGTLKIKRPKTSIISTPISTQWKIKEADLIEAMNEESNTYLYSEDVNVASFFDIKYFLGICPNFINDENQSEVFLELNVENEEKIKAVFDFSIVAANYNHGTQYVFEESDDECDVHVCSTEDLFNPSKGFIVDGYLTINFQGVLMIEKHRFITLNCKKEVAPKSSMENDEKDFVIVVGEKEIQVHKQVLSDVSSVFAGMLESGMREAIENKMYIKDFSFKIVDIGIKLCYGNSILLKYSLEILLSIYRFGDKYRIEFIKDLIEEYLIKEISPSNLVYLIKFSAPDSLNVKKLHQSCIAFLIKCIKESTPIYAFESLDEKFVAAVVLNSLRPNVDTHIPDNSDDDLVTADTTMDTDDTDTDDESLTEDTTASTDTDGTDIDD